MDFSKVISPIVGPAPAPLPLEQVYDSVFVDEELDEEFSGSAAYSFLAQDKKMLTKKIHIMNDKLS